MVGCLGILIERFLFRRFYRSDPILSLLLTFGLAMVIEQGLRIVFGATPLPFSIPSELRGQVLVGDFIYPRYRLFIFGIALAAVTATWFIVYRTTFGRVVRAGCRTPTLSVRFGISLAPYMTAIAALGVGLAGLGPMFCSLRLRAYIRRWARKFLRLPSSSWSSGAWVRSGA